MNKGSNYALSVCNLNLKIPFLEESENEHVELSDETSDSNCLQNLNKLMMECSPISEICSNEILSKVEKTLSAQKEKKSKNRTAKLWIQYMNMIDIMKKFIRAERLGNWHLHLEATKQMLPYIAATGHNNYLKLVHL